MRKLCCAIMIAALCGACARKPPAEKDAAATQAALDWLKLIDEAAYDQSWETAAPYFQQAVPKENWVQQIRAVRKPLGATKSRKKVGARYTTELPGAPDGEYVLLRFDSSFANKNNAIETITPMLTTNGWRVSGYYIR